MKITVLDGHTLNPGDLSWGNLESLGDYILNIEDFKNQSVFDDEIGRYSYPIDIHIAKSSRGA